MERRPAFAALASLALLAAASATFVSAADFSFEWAGTTAVESALRDEIIWKRAWVTNTAILLAVYALALALTSRIATALLLISPLYIGFVIANLAKIKYMHTGIHPLDVLRLPEFLPFFSSFFGTFGVLATVLAVGSWLGGLVATARLTASRMPGWHRWMIGIPSLAIVAGFPIAFAQVPIASAHPVLRTVGAPNWGFKEHARRHGFLLSFLGDLPSAFVSTPPHYSRGTVQAALRRYSTHTDLTADVKVPVNLILYMVESLMDPADLGLRYTADPIPTIRRLRDSFPGGWAIVPEAFGGSANSEFEALTGMTMCFLPDWSVPYRQYLREPIPALPRALARYGYSTTAIQADPKYFFARDRAYDLLGFDRVMWLHETPEAARAARGASPSDNAIVDAIIQASRRTQPFFVFAFPASTHAPYDQGTYRNSDLHVVDPPGGDTRGETQEYINALRVADDAIARLIEHFEHQPEPTLIAIVGDHLPPLSWAPLEGFFRQISSMPPAERSLRRRRVPLALWANFELAPQNVELSISSLPSYLLQKIHLPPAEFLAVTDVVGRMMPLLGDYVRECDWGKGNGEDLDDSVRQVLVDYRLLQYDLLLGKRYALEPPTR